MPPAGFSTPMPVLEYPIVAKKRKMEHGAIHNGRLELDRETREIIRAHTKYLLMIWDREEKAAHLADDRMRTVQSAGRYRRASTICEVLETILSRGQHTLNPAEWLTAWTWATTYDRHGVPAPRTDQPSLPGME